MKRIQSKIIMLFLLLFVLLMAPVVWVVNDLLSQSYNAGVNKQVEAALKNGVDYSQELYQMRKARLAATLSRLIQQPGFAELIIRPRPVRGSFLPADSSEWRYLALQIYDADGRLIWRQVGDSLSDGGAWREVAGFLNSGKQREVMTNRAENRFAAVERYRVGGQDRAVTLLATLRDDFLTASQRGLETYQNYLALSLRSTTIAQSALYAFVLIGSVLLLLTLGMAVWLSQRLTRPLKALVRGTEELGAGNLDYRIAVQSSDEIGELAGRFNEMAVDIKAFQEKTIYLEKMAAWQEIARRLAHEIKNPLTPIQLTVQEMVDQYPGGDEAYSQLVHECHEIISEEIENLRRLVREFSDFGRLPQLQFAEMDVNRVIRDLQRLYPHHPVELALAAELPLLQLDEDRIRRVLINLIENAIQADDAHHPIIVGSELDGDAVRITVADHGSGIPETLRERIFEPYFSTKTNGIGLGLAITRKMIEEHGGTIDVAPTPGGGSTFSFRLPINNGHNPESP